MGTLIGIWAMAMHGRRVVVVRKLAIGAIQRPT